jgi:ABC-type nitrate/sulfonate/bicarbonate transport system permease component
MKPSDTTLRRKALEIVLVFAIGILAWQAWKSLSNQPQIVVPSPKSVGQDLFSNPGVYASALASTVEVAAIGLVGGLVCGIAMAIVAWRSRLAGAVLSPVAVFAQSVPIVAIIPVIARVLGYTNVTIIVTVTIMSFFPSFVFVGAGLRAVPPAVSDVFTALGAAPRHRLLHVALPCAVPGAVAAVRIGASTAIIIAVVVQTILGTSGLGAIFSASYLNLQLDRAWGVALVIILFSMVLFALTSSLERLVVERWRL